jgi:PAS domain S-box-containing protein
MSNSGRILLADDEKVFLRSTAALLRQEGYECVCAPDGSTAVTLLHEARYDLLITDLKMPGNAAFEVLTAAQQTKASVIVITAYPSVQTALTALRLPVIDYLIKPFDFSALLTVVRSGLEQTCRHEEQARRMQQASSVEAAFRQLLESAPDAVVIVATTGHITLMNRQAECMFGYQRDELLGQPVERLLPARFRQLHGAHRARYASAPSTRPMGARQDLYGQRKDGSEFPVEISLSPLHLGEEVLIISIIRDISARQQAEKALRESEQRYRELFENANDIIYTHDLQGRFTSLNKAGERVTGYTRTDAFTLNVAQLVAPEYQSLIQTMLARKMATGEPTQYEIEIVAKDGRRIPLEVSTRLIYQEEQPIGIQGIARDISERRQAQEALRAETRIAAALAEVGRAMIASLDTPVMLERLCHMTTQVLGGSWSCTFLQRGDEKVCAPVATWGCDAEQQEIVRLLKLPRNALVHFMAHLAAEEVLTVENPPLHQLLPALLLRPLDAHAALFFILRRGQDLVGFQVCGYQEATEFTSFHRRVARSVSQIASLALANADLLEELQRANFLKENFINTMSHELRTPLHIILGYTELLLDHTFDPLTSAQVDILKRVERNAHQLLEMIVATLDLSRLQNQQSSFARQAVDVPALWKRLVEDTRDLIARSSLQVELRLSPALPFLYTDPIKLQIVLKNLLINALKFTVHGSVIISAQEQEGQMEICVSDTGCGIERQQLAVIFEPFYQVEQGSPAAQKGTGLGLYIVQQLLKLLEGTISVESEVGKGSTFRVRLPLGGKER